MNVAEFYAESHFRDPFWATEDRPNPHRGLDVAGWPTGTPVPAWIGGTVATSEYQTGLGWVVTVATPLGYAGVSHLNAQGAPVGAYVPFGGTWGPLGNTGTLSRGQHAHLTLSQTSRFPWTGSVIDPTPHIRAARDGASTAGGDLTPINESEFDMSAFILSSPGGQSLVIDDEIFGFAGPDDVRATSGAPVVGVSAGMHSRILQRLQQKGANLPVIVSVPEGDGTIYAMTDGQLTPLVDPRTVAELEAKGALVITVSRAEAENLLRQ